MRYAVARYSKNQRDNAYRFYLTDCLRMITENAAKMCQGTYITDRFCDIITGKPCRTIFDPMASRKRIFAIFRETEVDNN